MPQIINDPYRNESQRKAVTNQPLVSGVSNLISGLIQGQTQRLIERKQREQEHFVRQQQIADATKGLQYLLNIPEKEARHLAHLPTNMLEHVVKGHIGQYGFNPASSGLTGLEALAETSPEYAQDVAELLGQESINPAQIENIVEQQKAEPTQIAELMRPEQQIAPQPAAVNALPPQQMTPVQPTQEAIAQEKIASAVKADQRKEAPVKEQVKKITLAEQKERRKLEHEQKKQSAKERETGHKETQKYYDQVLATEKAAKESDNRLDRMLKLIDEGSLPFSAYYSGLKNLEEHVSPTSGAGVGSAIGTVLGGVLGGAATGGLAAAPAAATGGLIGAAIGGLVSPVVGVLRSVQRLTSPDTEEFEKLSNQFISGAKAVFGARITDQDLKAYMAQIPTLSNTDAGKRKIIKSMKIANDAEHVRAKVMKDIIRENGGKRPADLAILVEERAQSELDKLAEKFVGSTQAERKAKKEAPVLQRGKELGAARTIQPVRPLRA